MAKPNRLRNIFLLFALLTLLACQQAPLQPKEPICKTPYLEWRAGECCLDANHNLICDIDESVPRATDGNEVKQSATKTAQLFAIAWENKDYTQMYEAFIPELQQAKTLKEFKAYMQLSEFHKNLLSIRFDNVIVENDNRVYVQYTYNTGVFKTELPTISLHRIGNFWRVDAFSNFFTQDLIIGVCGETASETCISELARLLGREDLCVNLRCSYLSCLSYVRDGRYAMTLVPAGTRASGGKYMGYTQEEFKRQCELCHYYLQFADSEKDCLSKVKEIFEGRDYCKELGCPEGTIAIGNINTVAFYPCDCRNALHLEKIAWEFRTCFKTELEIMSNKSASGSRFVKAKEC